MNLDPLTRHALEVSALRPDPLAAALPAMDAAMRTAATVDAPTLLRNHPDGFPRAYIDFIADNPDATASLDGFTLNAALNGWRFCPCGSRELDEEGRCARCGAEGGGA